MGLREHLPGLGLFSRRDVSPEVEFFISGRTPDGSLDAGIHVEGNVFDLPQVSPEVSSGSESFMNHSSGDGIPESLAGPTTSGEFSPTSSPVPDTFQ